MKRLLIFGLFTLFLFYWAPLNSFAGEVVYGWDLLTPQERTELWQKMREATTPEERQMLREEHYKMMQERAMELGVTLRRDSWGPGRGGMMGPGMGGMMRGPKGAGMMGPSAGGVYGWDLMTPDERTELWQKMREATTPEERQMLREEHYKMMQERAKELGVTLRCDSWGPGRGGMMGPAYGRGGMRGGPPLGSTQ